MMGDSCASTYLSLLIELRFIITVHHNGWTPQGFDILLHRNCFEYLMCIMMGTVGASLENDVYCILFNLQFMPFLSGQIAFVKYSVTFLAPLVHTISLAKYLYVLEAENV